MTSRTDAFEPTLAQGPSAPELVDVDVPSVDEGAASRYESGDVLGEGGMGEVRLCRDLRIGRKVAVKRLKKGIGSRSDARARFLREARVQGQLEHPSVVPVYDLGRTPDGTEYFTMKRVRGRTLAEILADGGAGTSTRKLLNAFSNVCLAVHYAHMRGVLHRDLKPANVMLGDFGEVYVLDWGLAKVTGAPDPSVDEVLDTSRPDELLTQAGFILGTPGYIAPEILEGADADARADVYALGAILFEIIAGEPLRPGKTADERIAATLEGAERRPTREAPPELVALCLSATARRPADRLASAGELHEAIERYLDGDRDLALRREAAERHAGAARAAFERALAEEDDAPSARQRALHEVGRAIALDPENASAKATMLGLLTTPPKVTPPDAARELEGYENATLRTHARVAAAAYASFFLFVPLCMWSGVRNWGGFLLACALTVCTVALALGASFVQRPTALLRNGVMILSSLAISVFSMVFGPFLMLPAILSTNGVAFATRPRSFQPRLVLAVSALALVGPLILEWIGLLPPSYSFTGGELHILPRFVEFPALPTQIFLVAGTIFTIVVGVSYAAHTHGAAAEAERRLFMHLWQLRQLVPADAQHAVRAPTPTVFKSDRCLIL